MGLLQMQNVLIFLILSFKLDVSANGPTCQAVLFLLNTHWQTIVRVLTDLLILGHFWFESQRNLELRNCCLHRAGWTYHLQSICFQILKVIRLHGSELLKSVIRGQYFCLMVWRTLRLVFLQQRIFKNSQPYLVRYSISVFFLCFSLVLHLFLQLCQAISLHLQIQKSSSGMHFAVYTFKKTLYFLVHLLFVFLLTRN